MSGCRGCESNKSSRRNKPTSKKLDLETSGKSINLQDERTLYNIYVRKTYSSSFCLGVKTMAQDSPSLFSQVCSNHENLRSWIPLKTFLHGGSVYAYFMFSSDSLWLSCEWYNNKSRRKCESFISKGIAQARVFRFNYAGKDIVILSDKRRSLNKVL